MAVAGPNYKCLYYDIGTNGRVNDGRLWNKCGLAKALDEGTMNLPLPCCLPGGNEQMPYKTMILPIFAYCDVAWHGCGKGNSDVLESLQHRTAKLIFPN